MVGPPACTRVRDSFPSLGPTMMTSGRWGGPAERQTALSCVHCARRRELQLILVRCRGQCSKQQVMAGLSTDPSFSDGPGRRDDELLVSVRGGKKKGASEQRRTLLLRRRLGSRQHQS